jgi:hypothetical protein
LEKKSSSRWALRFKVSAFSRFAQPGFTGFRVKTEAPGLQGVEGNMWSISPARLASCKSPSAPVNSSLSRWAWQRAQTVVEDDRGILDFQGERQ